MVAGWRLAGACHGVEETLLLQVLATYTFCSGVQVSKMPTCGKMDVEKNVGSVCLPLVRGNLVQRGKGETYQHTNDTWT